MVERPLGRLEASILSDAKRASSDVRLPTVPPPYEFATVRARRQPGYVCAGADDLLPFLALRQIFPRLTGWTLATDVKDTDDDEQPALKPVDPGSARLQLVQSVLALNASASSFVCAI